MIERRLQCKRSQLWDRKRSWVRSAQQSRTPGWVVYFSVIKHNNDKQTDPIQDRPIMAFSGVIARPSFHAWANASLLN